MNTDFSTDNQDFSNLAHEASKKQVYPVLFGCDQQRLHFETVSVGMKDERSRIYDGEMGIDRLVSVDVDWLKKPLRFTIQERFRKIGYRKSQDLTITVWNYASNLPSELYKINAGIFLYGYYCDTDKELKEWIAINTTALMFAMSKRVVLYSVQDNPRTKQRFFAFPFKALHDVGCVMSHYQGQP